MDILEGFKQMNRIIGTSIVISLVMSISLNCRGAEPAFPEEELAKESVLPVFDVPTMVKNRKVTVDGRFEFGGFAGWVTDEPIYNQTIFGGIATYHFNEVHGVNLIYGQHSQGVGNYSKDLKKSVGLDFSKTFAPQNYIVANYQLTGYYGKISLLKNWNANIHLYGLIGAGTVMYQGLSEFALDYGVGQRIYFTKNFALRFDYRFMRYNGPNPVSVADKDLLKSGKLKISDYASTTYFLNHVTLAFVFLL
jgi:outer membrane beta-barrel protein